MILMLEDCSSAAWMKELDEDFARIDEEQGLQNQALETDCGSGVYKMPPSVLGADGDGTDISCAIAAMLMRLQAQTGQ